MGPGTLRVCDFGRVSALRSQTLWHALAVGVSAGAPPTLAFMRPDRPYVGIGYHRRAEEVDLAWCASAGLPVYRRQAGGGVVYLDDGQLFFQVIVPAASVPAARERALACLLTPALEGWRTAGVDARLDAAGEIVAGASKVCGHAAAQIGGAVVVVGNLIERFDHAAAARVVALPGPARATLERLMRRHVGATPVDEEVFRKASVEAYAEALGLEPGPGALNGEEESALRRLDERFQTSGWLAGPVARRGGLPAARAVKVRAGVAVVVAEASGATLVAEVTGDTIDRAEIVAPARAAADTAAAADDLAGLTLPGATRRLAAAGAELAGLAGALASLRGPLS